MCKCNEDLDDIYDDMQNLEEYEKMLEEEAQQND